MSERERLVALEGALNWRDLGGYRAADGRVTKWDRIYRSDGLDQLTDADLDVIAELGIKLVVDFRVDREVDENPSRLADHPEVRCQRLPIGGDEVEGKSILEVIRDGELKPYTIEEMAGTYERLLEQFGPTFGQVIGHAADPANHPVVFHCTAGKDRTGLMAMLLLGALGVSDDDIVTDYELTTHYRSNKRLAVLAPELEKAGVDLEDVLPYLTARAPVMAATIERLRRDYGSIEAFLTARAGVDSDTLDSLRAELLEPVKP
jgi:protein-tyrosine phosphatase